MESIMLTIKYVLFCGFEVFVVATVGATVIAGVYQVIRDRVRRSRTVATVPVRN
jgi:hypothetical protein